jgi:hypothetical protein
MDTTTLDASHSMTDDTAGLLPIQYGDTVRPSSPPELRLMAAVLRRAITDFRYYASDKRPTGKEIFRVASEWIASRDVSWPYSFENICQTFDIDAHDLRRALVRDRTLHHSARARRREPNTIVLAPREGSTGPVWEPLAPGRDEKASRESHVA